MDGRFRLGRVGGGVEFGGGRVPNALQTLAGEAGGASTSDVLNVTASATYVASGALFILGPLFTGPVNAVLRPRSWVLPLRHSVRPVRQR